METIKHTLLMFKGTTTQQFSSFSSTYIS